MSSLFSYIKSQLSIIDVIGEYVQLKPAGHYLKGPCPFHSEKDASFTVSPDKQIFYCFGCHASGDVIGFIAKKENMAQLEAAQLLIEQYKLTIPQQILQATGTTFTQNRSEKELYLKIYKVVSTLTHKYLLHNQTALEYLEHRNISMQSIKAFNLGYFPSGTQGTEILLKDLQREGLLLKDILDVGIVVEGRAGVFSPFEERIIFPIKDGLGRVCGFGGRIFKSGDDRPKYYNSREADNFEKGKLLFGFDEAKKSLHQEQTGFLVEGYMDCIMMAQSGYINTVATLGTACTHEHLKALSRLIHTLHVLYDGDNAGQKAMLRLTELCWEVNLELKIISLPENHDPASYLSKYGTLEKLIPTATDIMSFFITSTGSNFVNKPLSQKLTTAEKITSLIAKIEAPFKQDLLLHHAASITQLPFSSLKELMKTSIRRPKEYFQTENNTSPVKSPEISHLDEIYEISLLEEKIFSAILASIQTSVVLQVPHDVRKYFSTQGQQLLEQLDSFLLQKQNSSVSLSDFCNTLDEHHKQWIMRVSIQYNNQGCQATFEYLLGRFYKYHWQKIVKDTKEEIIKAKQDHDEHKVQSVLERFNELKHEILQQTRGLIR